MQGLHTGNYTFQVRMLDMAGNLGNATQLYAFAVDASLPLPGSESAGWFSGWHKWAIIAGAAALGLLLLLGAERGVLLEHQEGETGLAQCWQDGTCHTAIPQCQELPLSAAQLASEPLNAAIFHVRSFSDCTWLQEACK